MCRCKEPKALGSEGLSPYPTLTLVHYVILAVSALFLVPQSSSAECRARKALFSVFYRDVRHNGYI